MATANDQMDAVLLLDKGFSNLTVGKAAKPEAGAGQALIKIEYTALNPVDWKMAEYGFMIDAWPALLGCDAAGVVEAVGEGCSRIRVGDRVAGFTGLGAKGGGTFATHCVAPEDLLFRVPVSFTLSGAATLGVGSLTAAIALFDELKLKEPGGSGEESTWVLVWGGSSSVGAFGVQLAHLAGYRVVATASPRNHALLRSLGADAVVDRRDPEAEALVRAAAGAGLRYALDTVGPDTAEACARLLPAGGKLVCCAGGPREVALPEGAESRDVFLGNKHDTAEGRDLVRHMIAVLERLMEDGSLRPNATEIVEGGVGAVVPALKRLKEGKVSGAKVVVRMA